MDIQALDAHLTVHTNWNHILLQSDLLTRTCSTNGCLPRLHCRILPILSQSVLEWAGTELRRVLQHINVHFTHNEHTFNTSVSVRVWMDTPNVKGSQTGIRFTPNVFSKKISDTCTRNIKSCWIMYQTQANYSMVQNNKCRSSNKIHNITAYKHWYTPSKIPKVETVLLRTESAYN